MKSETAGDPMTGLKWTRKSTAKISDTLRDMGIEVGRNTVGKLLKEMDFRLRVNHKKRSTASPQDRDKQFKRIKKVRKLFTDQGEPVISIDSKKRELVGNFRNVGVAWKRHRVETFDHDFRSISDGVAIPYGIYDTNSNRGFVVVGTSRETPEFAVDNLVTWWQKEGRKRYPKSSRILILADGGGGNAPTSRVWRRGLQAKFCDRFGITVTACHYPPGASKWNPIEHLLFSQISRNWEGEPLDSLEKILKYIRTTTTKTGLKVRAQVNTKTYETGVKVSDEQMAKLSIQRYERLPKWNYTIKPRTYVK